MADTTNIHREEPETNLNLYFGVHYRAINGNWCNEEEDSESSLKFCWHGQKKGKTFGLGVQKPYLIFVSKRKKTKGLRLLAEQRTPALHSSLGTGRMEALASESFNHLDQQIVTNYLPHFPYQLWTRNPPCLQSIRYTHKQIMNQTAMKIDI